MPQTMCSSSARIALKNVLYLTDFSKPSEAALPVAVAVAQQFGGSVHAVHVLLSDPYAAMVPEMAASLRQEQEEKARSQMLRLEPRLRGASSKTTLIPGSAVWPALQRVLDEHETDVIVLGTRGRTGAAKVLLGSVAEEVLRRSRVPVITMGPAAHADSNNGNLERVLLATDLSSSAPAVAVYALSLAQENEAQLILLHVLRPPVSRRDGKNAGMSVAETLHHLHELVPPDAELWCHPDTLVEYGDPAVKILDTARQWHADLIVMGIRDTQHPLLATHLQNSTAHKVVAEAPCPVLTVRPNR